MTDIAARTARPVAQAEEPVARSVPSLAGCEAAHSWGKRAIDIFGALLALLIFLPLLCSIALMVRLESGGPAIFRQRRTGHRGRIFTIYKFRTMTVAEDGGNVQQATRGDARVTAIGGILRKLSLDELPQFLNVLKGDMSMVGPRPHALAHDAEYGEKIPTYVDRFRAKPGLTGLAQVNGLRGEIRDLRCMRDRVAADRRGPPWSSSGTRRPTDARRRSHFIAQPATKRPSAPNMVEITRPGRRPWRGSCSGQGVIGGTVGEDVRF
jgi:putative colanic acid biosysnthesis UDP-glucose lipid carrier transferase